MKPLQLNRAIGIRYTTLPGCRWVAGKGGSLLGVNGVINMICVRELYAYTLPSCRWVAGKGEGLFGVVHVSECSTPIVFVCAAVVMR